MILWTWETDDGGASGVTDDEGTARRAAIDAMRSTGTATAMVEAMSHLGGGYWMESGYRSIGIVWTARQDTNGITWQMSNSNLAAAS
jgi:hypothetical protein